ncbi:MAG TPA: hypothetical protein VLS95_13850 [Arthrobacter sp.]|nr:hypothetical protein [Arthrobacter sp.]
MIETDPDPAGVPLGSRLLRKIQCPQTILPAENVSMGSPPHALDPGRQDP